MPDTSGPILDPFRRLWSKITFFIFAVDVRSTCFEELDLIRPLGPFRYKDKHVNGSSSLDLRAEKRDLIAAVAVESHFCENMTSPFEAYRYDLALGGRV